MIVDFDHGSYSGSKSIKETVNGSHDFTIRGYSLAKGMGPGKYISSDTFTVGDYNCAIYFYPDGKNVEDNSMGYKHFFRRISLETYDYLKDDSLSLHCDISFCIQDETFGAHKLILAARSPVFRVQFFGLVGDPNMEVVDLEDIEPSVFKIIGGVHI